MTVSRIIRYGAWALVLLVGVWAISVLIWPRGQQPVATLSDVSTIGGPFRLTSHRGEVVDNAALRGRPYLVFFGFTHCPDVCPTTLFELTELMKELGPAADRFDVLFVSVDSERDSQGLLARYMTSFDPRITALRGDGAATEQVLRSFAAYARKSPTEDGQYTMDHTAGVYLMTGEGRFLTMLDMHEPRDAQLAKLRRLATLN